MNDALPRIGRYRSESEPVWARPPTAPAGSPNVVVVLLDDVGFAQFGCFGGSIPTPNFDRLAAEGLRYTNFHTTALCSPTRACVLTGRNHHRVGMGRITDLAGGFPGYDARIPDAAAMAPAILTEAGYASYAVGKWHLTPDDELHMGATRRRWPLAKGFERFYGFMEGETNQFAPTLIHDNHAVHPPSGMDDGYHLTEDLVDRAIEYLTDLRNADPAKPFHLHFTPGACHSPHQAPPEWIERFEGAFDHGWDAERERIHARQLAEGILPAGTELSERPEWVPAWDSLPAEEQRLYARYMECFAAYLSHCDHHVGRLLGFIEELGELDSTVVMVMSDNGASSEGGPTGSVNDVRPWNIAPRELEESLERIGEIGGPWVHNNYPWGWTVAGNTPFKRWKRETHEGGVCDPLVVRYPPAVPEGRRGGTRRHYLHAIDVLPTLLDLCGVEVPTVVRGVEQMPLDGVSFAPTLADPTAAEVRDTQYFEMFACRALYHRGWKAVAFHPIFHPPIGAEHEQEWELYHVAEDPSECRDLAPVEPDRLREMVALWWEEAERNGVLPLDNAPFDLVFADPRPGTERRSRWVYRPAMAPVPEADAANIRNRSHRVTAEVDLGDDPTGAEGVLVAQGSGYGGWSLWAQDGRLHYLHNWVGLEQSEMSAPMPRTGGPHTLGMRFDREGDHVGTAHLLVDDEVVDSVHIADFTAVRWAITGEGLCCGFQDGLPVSRSYRGPFRFTATLHRVVIEAEGPEHRDPVAEAEVAIRAQ